MNKMNFSKRLGVSLAISISLFAFGATTLGDPFPWPVPSPRELMNDYGQFQHTTDGYFLHGGVDILKDSTTYVVAAESGWVARILPSGISSDILDWYIIVGTSRISDNEGWKYAHLKGDSLFRIKWPLNQVVRKGDTLGRVRHDSLTPSKTHLHLSREWGIRKYPSELDIVDAELKYNYPYKNPLPILDTSGLAQRHNSDFSGKKVVRDSTLDTLRWKVLTGDTFWIVNHKIDVETKAWYQLGNYGIGAYKITYSIEGTGSQGPKGFTFSNRLQTEIYDTLPPVDSAAVVSAAVYDTARSVFTVGCYIISNTDSMRVSFPYDSLSWLRGYWSTCQHRDRLWNQADAESNSVARFPDGKCIVLIRGEDERGNYKLDTLKVIVNNFPPQVKQTYPDSGELGVPRACTLQVLFDQPMDTASVRSGFRLRLAGDTASIPGTAWFPNLCDTLMYFKPTNPLGLDAAYVMTVSSTVKDIADSTMGVNYEAWFSTQPRDLHVSYYNNGSGLSQIEVRNNRFRTPSRQIYAVYNPASPFHLYGQKIAVDRDGNRYLCEDVNSSGEDRVAKYDTSGALVDSCLLGQRCFGITTDGDTLFVSMPLDSTRDSLHNHVMRLNLNGDTLSRWRSPDSAALEDVCYSPAANKVFALCWKWKRDTLPTSPWYVYALTLDRYTKAGQREASLNIPLSPTNPSWKPFRLISGKSRLFLARTWDSYSQFMRGDTVVMYDWDLNEVGTRFAAGDGGPVCDYRRVFSMTADKWNLYTLIKSTNDWSGDEFGNKYYWVHVFTPTGSHVRICNLLMTTIGEGFGALGIYPSVLDTAGGFSEWGGGIGDGGPQIAVLNSLLPRVYALGQCYPNPAKEGLRIDYALPKESHVSLRVFNVMGQLVRTLREGKEKPGFYKAEWDGKDQNGHRVSSGVYLYRMEAGEFRKVRKLVVVR